MKTLLTLFILIFSLSALAVDRGELNQLLLEKGTSIAAFEAQGLKLVMGERTGGGNALQYASVEVVFIKDEAILKKEMVNPRVLNGSLQSVQANGRHIQASDIIGIITK